MSAFSLALAALMLSLAAGAPTAESDDAECRAREERLETAVKIFRRVHGGKLPATLSDLYTEGFVQRLADFSCARSADRILARSEIDAKTAFTLGADGAVSEKAPHVGETTTKTTTAETPSPLHADEWTLAAATGRARSTIADGVLELRIDARGRTIDAWRRAPATGDLRIEVDYATGKPNLVGFGFGLRVRPTSGEAAVCFDRRLERGEDVVAAEYGTQDDSSLSVPAPPGDAGTLVLERHGTTWRFRHRAAAGTEWTDLGELEAPIGPTVEVGLTAYKVGSGEMRATVTRFRLTPSRD